MPAREARYLDSLRKGELQRKIDDARRSLTACTLCPRRCGVDRLSGDTGVCRTAARAWVASFSPHYGEEAPLVGSGGSGTIFFTHCSLGCNFCQNYDISHLGHGTEVSDEQLAAMMLQLQAAGCHNINFVTPSHVVPQILTAVGCAAAQGLRVPLVYNSSAYDRVSTLALLDGIFDIYMPDFKFWDSDVADRTCGAPDYPDVARRAVREMHRQVGDLRLDPEGVACEGLLLRHLVLPHGLAGTRQVMRFVARKLSVDTYVNIMPQYRPCGQAHADPLLKAPLAADEYREALQAAREEGLARLDKRTRVFMLW